MEQVIASEKSIAICNAHWWPEKARCHRCPIHKECTAPQREQGWTGLNAHIARVNAAAERVQQ